MDTNETPKKSRRGGKPKTERNQAMAADYDAGLSIDELAAKYGLKTSSVNLMIMQFRRVGLVSRQADRRPLRHVQRNNEIVSKYEAGGVTVRQLADEYGMTPVNVSSIIREASMRREASVDPFVTVTIRRTDVERFVRHRRGDAELRGSMSPDVQVIVEACEKSLNGGAS